MKNFTFDPFGNEYLQIEFYCDKCNHIVTSEPIFIPVPDYTAEKASDSQNENDYTLNCENCNMQYDIQLYSTFAGGNGTIEGLNDSANLRVFEIPEMYYEEQYEAISSNTLSFETFKTEISNLKELNKINIENPSVDKTLRRQIFIGVIASMETYLSDAFINTTLRHEKFIKKFVETFHDFRDRPIKLNDLFSYHEKIESICKTAMLEIIYHNLPKIKGMYKDTLNIDLGDISAAYKAVLTRHDLVHRNGKTKDGNELVIDKDMIEKLFSDIEKFISDIDEQFPQDNGLNEFYF